MLLRSSITTTKKFFQKTLKNFKSLFSSDYQKLPKSTSPHNHLSYFVAENHVMDIDMGMDMNISNKNGNYVKLSNASPYKEKIQVKKREVYEKKKNNEKRLSLQRGKQKDSSLFSNDMKERRYMVEEKLKELEMLDINNVDYVMDIEEVLHYYSRLTCPAYVEIVDRFFMEMYSDC
ncbi:hypothetical protein TSUD_141020 [Trifolium subterraneum]|uniref:OVATE domain-containing protein n=1 Tax=Trifolium subterraneum TaxID=3900 RepID=A0A2Z6NGB0_TRISU|nr:hypothetical protein TSUD_141020 [Trifolium subterraneum]